MKYVKYSELKDGDRVLFYGSKGTVSNVRTNWVQDFGPYKGERVYRFTVTFDDGEDLARYGQYQGGTYGGVESLEIMKIDD